MVNERIPPESQGIRLGCEGSAVQICPSRPLKIKINVLKALLLLGDRALLAIAFFVLHYLCSQR